MITFIAPLDQTWIIRNIRDRLPDDVASSIRALAYEELHLQKELIAGIYIFTGLGVISDVQRAIAMEIWNQLETGIPGIKLLNHPKRALGRYDLLKVLYKKGINDFQAYRISELPDATPRFPVFVREARRHTGSLTELLPDSASLESAIAELETSGYDKNDLLVVEYCHTADEDGLFRKYSAFKLGNVIMPRYLSFGYEWVVKENAPNPSSGELYDDAKTEEELRYIRENPHEEQLRKLFEMACIDYGRIDYSIKDKQLRVWEINTHPTVGRYPRRKRSMYSEERRQMRLRAKTHFYESFGEIVRKLNMDESKSKIFIHLSDDLLRSQKRERQKQHFVNTVIQLGERLPRVPGIQRLRTIIKRRVRRISGR